MAVVPASVSLVASTPLVGAQAFTGSTQFAEAIRFRTDFALSTDVALVSDLISKSDGEEPYGTPLSSEEKALMDRRNAIPGELDRVREYRATHWDTWGGMWLPYDATQRVGASVVTVNVGVTDSEESTGAALADLVPVDAELRVVKVDRSQAALDDLSSRISKDQDFFTSLGVKYYSATQVLSENLVEIRLSQVNEQIAAAANDRYGDGAVRVIVGSPVQPDACTRLNCGPPWRGGIKIYPSGPAYCTSGLVVRTNYQGIWSYAIWTAGHCASQTWREGSATGTVIGTTAVRYFSNQGAVDVQVIPISASNAINQYLSGTSSCNPCQLFWVFYSQGQNADEPGDPVCNNGAVSGSKCGQLVDTNYTFVWEEKNITLVRMRRATYSRKSGDSGGPVVNNYYRAAGSHTHYEAIGGVDYAVYSHVWEMEQVTGFIIYTT